MELTLRPCGNFERGKEIGSNRERGEGDQLTGL